MPNNGLHEKSKSSSKSMAKLHIPRHGSSSGSRHHHHRSKTALLSPQQRHILRSLGASTKRNLGHRRHGSNMDQMGRAKKLFMLYDPNFTGSIPRGNLVPLLRQLYIPSRAELDELVASFHDGKERAITWCDFKDTVFTESNYRAADLLSHRAVIKEIRAVFNAFDLDKDGVLEGAELVEFARSLLQPNPKVLRRMLGSVDMSDSPMLTFAQFVTCIKRLRGDLAVLWCDRGKFVQTTEEERKAAQIWADHEVDSKVKHALAYIHPSKPANSDGDQPGSSSCGSGSDEGGARSDSGTRRLPSKARKQQGGQHRRSRTRRKSKIFTFKRRTRTRRYTQ
eukprot:TRINITY_DN66051_c6_g1_i1.p1 TRINITY_DN66051_c6_g1~~TRINITY_DN66051_c6_g1_i1.p1  ORF type:complete len:388 (+),score=190.96 TRINITY_DN66051_c6_g1_i1:156-1166(+)